MPNHELPYPQADDFVLKTQEEIEGQARMDGIAGGSSSPEISNEETAMGIGDVSLKEVVLGTGRVDLTPQGRAELDEAMRRGEQP